MQQEHATSRPYILRQVLYWGVPSSFCVLDERTVGCSCAWMSAAARKLLSLVVCALAMAERIALSEEDWSRLQGCKILGDKPMYLCSTGARPPNMGLRRNCPSLMPLTLGFMRNWICPGMEARTALNPLIRRWRSTTNADEGQPLGKCGV